MSDATKIKNLWGDLPVEENIRTPYIILKEQASLLTEATEGVLIGEVFKKINSKDSIDCILRIKVPSINNYTINIVDIIYPLSIYPVEVRNALNGIYYDGCNSEQELENALSEILSSEEVRKIIKGLLSEVRADA